MRTKIRSEKKLPAGTAKIEVSTEYAEAFMLGQYGRQANIEELTKLFPMR